MRGTAEIKRSTRKMRSARRTLNASLAAVANEMPDPIGTEFGIIVDQVAYGDDLTDAFNEFADRIDQEDYGYCDTCGVEIGVQRLEARPTATQCVDCKTLDEIKEKQEHG